MSDTVGRQAGEVGREQRQVLVRTEHGGDEDNGGEENMSLHIESFVREKKLLDYLYGRNLLCHTIDKKRGERYFLPRDIRKALAGVW